MQARCEYSFGRQAPIFATQKTRILVYLRVRKVRTSLTASGIGRARSVGVSQCSAFARNPGKPGRSLATGDALIITLG